MKHLCAIVFLSTAALMAHGQKERPYRCGFYSKNRSELKQNFDRISSNFGAKANEKIASVGAANGYMEVQTSAFIDGLDWTLQDIDTTCLNQQEFEKVIRYHEQLIGKKIDASFDLVVGEKVKTNLTKNTYDRVLLINVYHELSHKKEMLADIYEALKPLGELVVMERMGKKRGEKHGDCGLPRLYEPDYLIEMKEAGFEMIGKHSPDKKSFLIFYTFKRS